MLEKAQKYEQPLNSSIYFYPINSIFMHIAFVHPHKAFLPGLQAYLHYFGKKGWKTSQWRTGTKDFPADINVFWHFMGTHYKKNDFEKKAILIHEYASLSVPPFRKIKDKIKSLGQTKPDFRLYTNNYIRESLNFGTAVPDGIRDVGIDPELYSPALKTTPEYDFIYVGSLHPHRRPEKMLDLLNTGSLATKKILLLGDAPRELKHQFAERKNIIFQPSVSREQVPFYLSRSRFALNYIPQTNPFQHQTPTKFLEYCAMNVPVISTSTPWLNEFRKNNGGNYWILEENALPDWDTLQQFPFAFPDMRPFSWENRIQQSGIIRFLEEKTN